MKRTILLAIFTMIVVSGIAQDKQKDYTEALKLIEVWLDAQKDFDLLPGISAVVVEDQEVLWSGAFGKANIDDEIQAEPSTIYSICSISKLFTSVAIMQLYERGKLRLDDQVSDLLPYFDLKQQFEDSWPITVRSLLTHSSGLPREANFPYWTGPDFPFPSQEGIREQLEKQETLYPSSTYFQYSNLGLTLLGEIVEEVSGVPYDDYIKQHILNPLDLADTRTELPENLYGRELAIGHSALTREHHREKVNLFQANGITPAAGFSSTVLDLGKFASWQFRLMDSTITEIIKPSSLKYMQNVHWTDPSWKTTWGLGFSVFKNEDGEKWVGHGGSCPGYRSSFQMIPGSKRAYSVMINASGTDPGNYISGMHAILSKVKDPKTQDNPGAKSGPDLKDYTGYYSPMPWGSELYVSSWYGKLVLINLPTGSPAKAMTLYTHGEGDTFYRERDDGKEGEALIFERDENGQVMKFERHGNYSLKIQR